MQTVDIKCYECFDCRNLYNTVLYNKLPKFLSDMRYLFSMISDIPSSFPDLYLVYFPENMPNKSCMLKISCMSYQNFNTLGEELLK